MRRSTIIVTAVLLAACLNGTDSTIGPDQPSDPATETFADNLHINISQMTKTSLGDYYIDLKTGTGPPLAGPRSVVFSYETFLKTGLLVDQQIGVLRDLKTVVRGLQDGMIGMQAGTERVIVVPSALGFGPTSTPPIPPNATLVFDVILNQIP
jgi:FKBP-type peptidyl-prolyl cis-trans isomerase FkpA